MRNRAWVAIVALTAFSIGASLVYAQLPTATILGIVRDATGAVVANATLTVTHTETGLTRTATSGSDGSYSFPALPVGAYEVRTQQTGFQTAIRSGLTLTVGQEAVVNFALEVGAVRQTISVTAEAPVVNTTSPALGGLVTPQKMEDLPLNGRNYIDLAVMQPGVTNDTNRGAAGTINGTWYSADGAPITSNNMLLDGTSLVNFWGGSASSVTGGTLGVDGIQEFRVLTGFFSAEYGSTMGSQMVMVSKSGTNRFHGDAFDFLRNDVLDATYGGNTWFAPPTHQVFRRNQFGGAVGGPIKKDRLFFHSVFESVKAYQPMLFSSPTLGPGCLGAGGTTVWNGSGAQPGNSNGPCPQLGLNPSGPGTNSVTVNSVSSKILPLFRPSGHGVTYSNTTLPNGAPCVGCQFSYTFPQPQNEYYGQGRVDYNFSAKDSLFTRYTVDRSDMPYGEPYPPFQDSRNSSAHYATLSENHTFSPAILSNARLSFSRTVVGAVCPSSIGGPGYSLAPNQSFGTFSVAGFQLLGACVGDDLKKQNVFTVSDDLFYTRGRHSLKMGALVNHYQLYALSQIFNRGYALFLDIPSLLQGAPLVILTGDGAQDRTFHNTTMGFYLQDDWHVKPGFTLNLGIRYEPWTVPAETHGLASNLQHPLTDTVAKLGPMMGSNPSFRNFGPRIGFAWDLLGNAKTAIRSGFGLLYDTLPLNAAYNDYASMMTPVSAMNIVAGPPAMAAFQAGLPIPLPPVQSIPAPGINPIQYDFQQPYVMQYNFTLEQQLPGSVALTASYVGSRGVHLLQELEVNPSVPVSVTNGMPVWPSTCPCPRLNPNFSSVAVHGSTGDSNYNSLQAGITKRMGTSLQFQSFYTWSKAIDDVQGAVTTESLSSSIYPSNPFNLRTDRGPASFNVPQSWKSDVLYRLPIRASVKGLAGKVLNGWSVGSIVTMQSGLPFSVSLSNNQSNSNVFTGGGGIDRPDYVRSGNLAAARVLDPGAMVYNPGTVITGNAQQWFNPHMFTLPAAGHLGEVSRDSLRGPRLMNWDFSLVKDTKLGFLGESGVLQFRSEFFNVVNHANLALPSSLQVIGPGGVVPGVGQITSLINPNAERQIQFALKLLF